MLIDSSLLLASPIEVLQRLVVLAGEKDFLPSLLFTFSRIFLGFSLSFITASLLGLLAGRSDTIENILWPYISLIKTVPVASFIILSLLFLKAKQLSVFISFLMGFPVIYTNVLNGIRSCDKELDEMAVLFRLSPVRKLLYVQLPQLKPYLLSSVSTALGLCWKAGVAAEVIAVTVGSIGGKLYEAKVYFLSADLLCWTLVLVLISVGFEKLFVHLLKRGFYRWEKR